MSCIVSRLFTMGYLHQRNVLRNRLQSNHAYAKSQEATEVVRNATEVMRNALHHAGSRSDGHIGGAAKRLAQQG